MNALSLKVQSPLVPVSGRDRAPESLPCALMWRQNQLLVRSPGQSDSEMSPSGDRLTECLERSSVRLISLTPDLGEDQLRLWADASTQAGKNTFLRVPSTPELPNKQAALWWTLKRLSDRLLALVMLVPLAPILLAIAVAIAFQSPGPVLFAQWRVGERGRLFRIYKFRTMIVGAEKLHHQVMGHQDGLHKQENDPRVTPLGAWLRKYSLDELPQIFNVLRGEMSFVGPRPWALYDAVRIRPEFQHRLNALPGITGEWQVTARSHLRDLDAVNLCDLEYLKAWSPWRDLKILLMTVPRVLSGFGAY